MTYAEVKACIDKGVVDPEFSPTLDQFIDLRAVTSFEMAVDQAKLLAASPHFSPSSKRALVASVPHVFGMGRLFAAYNEVWKGQPVNAQCGLPLSLAESIARRVFFNKIAQWTLT